MDSTKTALVVEGGAMRGIFAAGVLDYFLDHSLTHFDLCIGVSAGSTNLAGYLAGQRGRSHHIITDFSCRKPFINGWKFIKGQHYIDLDWLWDLCEQEYPLNQQAFNTLSSEFLITTTNVETGEADYHRPRADNVEDILKASCAVPFAYREFPVIDGAPRTDGGIADSIPVEEAYRRGARDITVILSQVRGFVKKPVRAQKLLQRMLKDSPRLAEAMLRRHEVYNRTIAFIDSPPEDCIIRVIAPQESFEVGRTTRHPEKLNAGYEMGRSLAANYMGHEPMHARVA